MTRRAVFAPVFGNVCRQSDTAQKGKTGGDSKCLPNPSGHNVSLSEYCLHVSQGDGLVKERGLKQILPARIDHVSMIIIVAPGELIVTGEEAVLNLPKKIFAQPVEKSQSDTVLLGPGSVRQAHV